MKELELQSSLAINEHFLEMEKQYNVDIDQLKDEKEACIQQLEDQ